jgi:hypothetical protein
LLAKGITDRTWLPVLNVIGCPQVAAIKAGYIVSVGAFLHTEKARLLVGFPL